MSGKVETVVPMPGGALSLLFETLRLLQGIFLYAAAPMRQRKTWTYSQAIRLQIVRWYIAFAYAFGIRPKMSLQPGAEGDRFEVVPLPSAGEPQLLKRLAALGIKAGTTTTTDQAFRAALYPGPLDDADIKPEPVGVTWHPRKPTRAEIDAGADVAIHFHGGAYVIGDGRDADCGFLTRGLRENTNVRFVLAPQYRLSSYPGGRFPAMLQDAVTVYLHLLGRVGVAPERVVLSGDSAGGNLVLCLLRFLASDANGPVGLPQPACAWLWSPWVWVSAVFDQTLMARSPNADSDYVLHELGIWGAATVSAPGKQHPGYASGPFMSPQLHPFATPVPMFLHVGGTEVMYHLIIDFYHRFADGRAGMSAAEQGLEHEFDKLVGPMPERGVGNNIELVVSENAPHDIPLIGAMLDQEEEYFRVASLAGKFFEKNRYVAGKAGSGK